MVVLVVQFADGRNDPGFVDLGPNLEWGGVLPDPIR